MKRAAKDSLLAILAVQLLPVLLQLRQLDLHEIRVACILALSSLLCLQSLQRGDLRPNVWSRHSRRMDCSVSSRIDAALFEIAARSITASWARSCPESIQIATCAASHRLHGLAHAERQSTQSNHAESCCKQREAAKRPSTKK